MSEQIKQGVCPTGVVKAICISDKRGIEKRAIEEGHFLVDFVFAYLKLVKNKPKTKGNDSLDDYDYGEEDSEEWETEDEEVLEDGFEGSDPNEERDRAD